MLEPLTMPGAGASLVHRWRAVVAAQPEGLAICSPGRSFTFRDADTAAAAVAVALSDLEDPAATAEPVGLLIDQDAAGLIALLGVLEAGHVAVVLDPHLPAERLATIAELAGVRVCLSATAHLPRARALTGLASVLDLDDLVAGADASAPAADRPLDDRPVRGGRDAAAIVFTSGSTGRPKGVVQTHQELLNDAYGHAMLTGLGPSDRVALVLPYGFAAGLLLVFGALLNGASVHPFDPRDAGTRGLLRWIEDQELTTLHCTPHLLRSVIGSLAPATTLTSLRLVCTVGEAVHSRDVEGIRAHLAGTASFVNWTGSSEVGTLTLYTVEPGAPVPAGMLPAGRPIVNKEIRLRREDGTEAAPGEAGELVVISDHLSDGYWAQTGENGARFGLWDDGRPSCVQGDLARFDEQGNLHLLGRADAAVKVRGYLVEPSEVEAAFLAEEGVKDVVVLAVSQERAPTRLAAYVVPDQTKRTQSPAALRRRLRERLPEYMVPGVIVNVPALPRNERGKVDRRQLPEVTSQPPSAPPTSQWEIVVADLWSEVLGLEQIGLDDDFLALGGDSLSVEEMLQSVQERLGVSLVSGDVVEAPTLRAFTARVTLGSATLPSHPDVSTLRSGGTRTPVFCFAGSGALALSFLPLARHLDDRSVYAFQAHGLERRSLPDRTVEKAAIRFLEIIRVIQPSGPYILLGHSFGGLVAVEVAQRLRAGGEQVELVGLLDTYLPHSAGQQPTFVYETLAERPPAQPEGRLRAGLSRVRDRLVPEKLPVLAEWARHTRARAAGVVPFSGQHQFDAFFDQGNLVTRRYDLFPYPGRTLLVLADANPDGAADWAPLLTGDHRVAEVPAEHSSLLREPWATMLAGIILDELPSAA